MRWARICRMLGLLGIGLFAVSAFTPLPNILAWRERAQAALRPAGAIVVLGAEGVGGPGTLGEASLRRVIRGVLLYNDGFAPSLVLLGDPSEAAVRASLARTLGVPSTAIVAESRARTTREEAQRASELLRPRSVRRILLVTDSLHMARARGVFERIGFEVLPAPADDDVLFLSDKPEDRLRIVRLLLQEMLARLRYRVLGYL
ncbi:MAG: YdcF family protein [Thermoanaerobaculia bacterium]